MLATLRTSCVKGFPHVPGGCSLYLYPLRDPVIVVFLGSVHFYWAAGSFTCFFGDTDQELWLNDNKIEDLAEIRGLNWVCVFVV